MVPTLQVIGKKKSGKTTTMIRLIEIARHDNLEVAAFKHTHHSVAMDVAGTDTDRFAQAGANQVGMQQDGGFFWHETRPMMNKPVPLENEIAHYVAAKTELILIEGFKWESYPKILLLRPNDEVADFAEYGPFLTIATIFPEKVGPAVVDFTTAEKVAQWFSEWLQEEQNKMTELTHFNEQERARMVDVTEKQITHRKATAEVTVVMQPETLQRIKEGQVKKGDVLAVAQVAGIMAAKKTSELIPMCHPLLISGVDIHFRDNDQQELTITATVKVTGQTGVEMEALTAAQVAALTVYDMCKAMDKGIRITNGHLVEKIGGKSGHYVNPAG